ncbi:MULTISPECIES: flagellar motor switch protein FliG [sulfur-oxidizing symbionts]|jgi:flagellar motor switch protein FliG|uniref:Flagellar motor switch protein FliG n=3 Tax=Gammaproteobacteria TaxID=1236 RepID=G2FCE9_9GAMM|nr:MULTISPECIES: flagellar motor switch protein FliG [sulfur-oxidizing symbionts]EGV50532.1 flagellar motor switch protein FliG [endosymbiont of Riftia pachyptila (vent Ph05)]EGW55512.1 flagellar motor switch protein FliG [endosymbiont of Tevnia jerichonana (vent Tica)]USF86662.1 flagellar motor switch protein FliG [Candidatus Endoriftia persephone]
MPDNKNAMVTEAEVAEVENISGLNRAAILLLALGENDAAELLKHMGPKEVQDVGMAMAGLTNVTTDQMEMVMRHFVANLEKQTALGLGSDEYIRNMLTNALGADKAGGVIDRILLGRNSKGLEQLKWMDSRSIAELIRLEHPQIIAIVLSFLEADQAAEVLSEFSERIRTDIIMRIATLDGIQPKALQELDEILEKQFSGATNVKSSNLGGIDTASSILNLLDGAVESQVMDEIMEADADLGQELQDNMFVFDNLIDVDDRGIQTLLREVASEQLLLALRAADEGLKEKIFKNMSKRAAEMLADDLEAAAPTKLSDVEAAQKEILQVARRLSDAGEIMLGGGGDEFV